MSGREIVPWGGPEDEKKLLAVIPSSELLKYRRDHNLPSYAEGGLKEAADVLASALLDGLEGKPLPRSEREARKAIKRGLRKREDRLSEISTWLTHLDDDQRREDYAISREEYREARAEFANYRNRRARLTRCERLITKGKVRQELVPKLAEQFLKRYVEVRDPNASQWVKKYLPDAKACAMVIRGVAASALVFALKRVRIDPFFIPDLPRKDLQMVEEVIAQVPRQPEGFLEFVAQGVASSQFLDQDREVEDLFADYLRQITRSVSMWLKSSVRVEGRKNDVRYWQVRKELLGILPIEPVLLAARIILFKEGLLEERSGRSHLWEGGKEIFGAVIPSEEKIAEVRRILKGSTPDGELYNRVYFAARAWRNYRNGVRSFGAQRHALNQKVSELYNGEIHSWEGLAWIERLSQSKEMLSRLKRERARLERVIDQNNSDRRLLARLREGGAGSSDTLIDMVLKKRMTRQVTRELAPIGRDIRELARVSWKNYYLPQGVTGETNYYNLETTRTHLAMLADTHELVRGEGYTHFLLDEELPRFRDFVNVWQIHLSSLSKPTIRHKQELAKLDRVGKMISGQKVDRELLRRWILTDINQGVYNLKKVLEVLEKVADIRKTYAEMPPEERKNVASEGEVRKMLLELEMATVEEALEAELTYDDWERAQDLVRAYSDKRLGYISLHLPRPERLAREIQDREEDMAAFRMDAARIKVLKLFHEVRDNPLLPYVAGLTFAKVMNAFSRRVTYVAAKKRLPEVEAEISALEKEIWELEPQVERVKEGFELMKAKRKLEELEQAERELQEALLESMRSAGFVIEPEERHKYLKS